MKSTKIALCALALFAPSISFAAGCGGCDLNNQTAMALRMLPKPEADVVSIKGNVVTIAYVYAKSVLKIEKPQVLFPNSDAESASILVNGTWKAFTVDEMNAALGLN